MYQLNPLIKKYIIYSLFFIALIVAMWLLYTFLTTASVDITTNNPKNVISIEETRPEHKTINTGGATGHLKIRLHTGTYTITVKNGYASAQQIISLGIGDSKKVTITVNDQANKQGVLEAVTNLGAYETVADNTSVKFLDRNHNPAKLYQIDSSNILTNIAPNLSFDSISWADTSFGVGRMGDQLMTIEGTTVTNLTTPVTAKTFTVAPNKDVYISDGQALYRGSTGHNFTKVLSAEPASQIKLIAASNDAVLLTDKFNDSNRESELVVLHKDGSKNTTDGDIYEGQWSKSGKYLATTGDTSTIFNDKLQKVVSLPINNVLALTWMDDNNLAYAEGNLIWKFSVDSHQATVLATTSNGVGAVSQMRVSQDGSSLYVAVQNPDTSNGYTFYLARYKLNSDITVNPLLQKISLVLPNTPIDGCSVGYVNFTKITVTITAIDRIQQLCIDATKTYLQGYDINPDSVNLQFIPVGAS